MESLDDDFVQYIWQSINNQDTAIIKALADRYLTSVKKIDSSCVKNNSTYPTTRN